LIDFRPTLRLEAIIRMVLEHVRLHGKNGRKEKSVALADH
jgi:hypothetical protein